MNTKESDVIAAEIKIGIALNSWAELNRIVGAIREVCQCDYKLNVNVEGNFFPTPASEKPREPAVEFDGQMAEQSLRDAKVQAAKKRNAEIDDLHRAIDWVTGRGNTYPGFGTTYIRNGYGIK